MGMLTPPTIHQIEGKYRVLAQLGQGGTANVSLAALRGPSGFNKLVVLKSMKHALKAEPEFARMFMTEARLAARLNHPNIVQTNEVFEFHGLPVIVMEYLEGQPLSNILMRAHQGGGFPLAMHLKVLSDVLGALHYAHELRDYDGTPLGVVHRDVSPHNVFVTFDGQVKLLDFGIAKLAGTHAETATGVIKGKLRYMPPEQVAAEGVDRRSDVYSVGVMLWEAVTGKKLWQGMSDATVMNRVLTGHVIKAKEMTPDVPPELERIIDKAMAPEPEHRFATALEMQAELNAFLDGLPSPVHHRDIGKRVADSFADVREQTRRLLDEHLSKVASLTEAEFEKIEALELTPFASVSGGSQHGPLPHRGQGWRVTRGVAGAAFGALIVALLAGWHVLARSEASAPSAPVAVAVAEASSEPQRVMLRVTAFPKAAKLYVAGELLEANPGSLFLSRDPTQSVLVEARAEGYEAQSQSIKLDHDADIVLTLAAKVPPEEQPSTRTHDSAAKRRATPVPGPAASNDLAECNPPHFFDERGVKKYKPQCL